MRWPTLAQSRGDINGARVPCRLNVCPFASSWLVSTSTRSSRVQQTSQLWRVLYLFPSRDGVLMIEALGSARASQTTVAEGIICFANFEVDVRAGQLRRGGIKIKLAGQPFDVLVALLQKPGQVVTREELHDKLWSQDTFVDFEHGLNKAINKVREALGDAADKPRFIETLPRRGYRFLPPVVQPGQITAVPVSPATPPDNQVGAPSPVYPAAHRPKRWRMGLLAAVAAVAVVIAVLGVLTAWRWKTRSSPQLRVVRFLKLTDDGQPKSGPMATDGVRIYFTETLPGVLRSLAQVSTTGGEVVRLPNSLERPRILDLSRDGTELLLGNPENTGVGEDSSLDSLWVQPVAGGSPRRVGSKLVNDAAWGAQPATVVYGDGDSVYLMKRDGTDSHKLLSQAGSPFSFSFSPDGQVLRFSLRLPTTDHPKAGQKWPDPGRLAPARCERVDLGALRHTAELN